MKKFLCGLYCLLLTSCNTLLSPEDKNEIDLNGTWKMVYAEIKDLTHTSFIKIINDSHFAFFNQDENNQNSFYGGAGTYMLDHNKYIETLSYTSIDAVRNHEFPFTIEMKGDTLIQFGLEHVKEANINREIVEKYIKLK